MKSGRTHDLFFASARTIAGSCKANAGAGVEDVEYEYCGVGIADRTEGGGTQAFSAAHVKKAWVLPLFMFSRIGRMTIS
jgi:hypothetical protein